ncbi:peptidoglycan-binding protein CsiV [Panacagrimonas perspica]|uniref:Peptidoglycan-binding protein CsiV n=1 Tax=Panacagrimonas perspica TaxID=381431 RepID=A0A4R7PE67_9GAMM|nr:CsiV family protein [Panacagrimonas perspica]TDU32428.1 peptidoglycan-binding protein CsiV [Panacagrimonas perspica]
MKSASVSRWSPCFLSLVLLLASTCAHAETWRVDLIVFRFLGGIDERGRLPQAPGLAGAIELDNASALSAAGITVLPDADFGLNDQWSKLKSSPQFKPLIRIAWTQNDPPVENGPRLHLMAGSKLKIRDEQGLGEREFQEVDGTVALHLGRFLHLDAAMIFTSPGEPAQSWMLSESRKMRSEELHHLDSPRLGLITKVSKWGPGLTSTVPAATP